MQTKTSTILITGCLAIILLAGAFAGGISIGWALPRTETLAPQAQSTLPTDSPSRSIATRAPTATGEVQITPAPTATGQAQTSTDVQTLFKPFWESWDLVHQQYVDQPVDNTSLMQGAIKGMLDSLGDAHTFYSDPKSFQQQMTQLSGQQYEGIGAWVDTTGTYLKIISPMPNSPAEKAGLKAGDIIIAVDKQDVTGISGDLVLKLSLIHISE